MGGRRVLDRLNLEVQRGEFFAVLGPSGCGKTTTLRLIAGLEYPTSGEIRINGQPMGSVPPYRRDVNTVFQNYALFPHLTVFRNIAFGLEMQRLDKQRIAARVADAIALVRLAGFEDRYPHQLSGGQQQRVALARALVRAPSVLLLDEPLGALDPQLRKAMQLELKRLQRRLGMSFIYVTHDQEEALSMADRMGVMHEGRIAQVGPPVELYERPETYFVASFLGETNFLTGRVAGREAGMVCVQVGQTLLRICEGERAWAGIGQAVTVAVRPERIVLRAEPSAEGHNSLPASVEELIYRGGDVLYLVRLDDAHGLTVRQPSAGLEPQLRPGQRVFACFAPHSARLLREGPPE
jgi:spermidine/putrescine transport system ATP-binding protein